MRTKVCRSGYDVYDIPVLKAIGGSAERSGCYPLLKGERCQGQFFVHERSEPRTRSARALYAYPLAGVLWLGLDVPATVLGHLTLAPPCFRGCIP